jgi:hypothetical protein
MLGCRLMSLWSGQYVAHPPGQARRRSIGANAPGVTGQAMTTRRRDRDGRDGGSSHPSEGPLPKAGRRAWLLNLAAGFAMSAAFYLLLIDTTEPPELYAGAGAAVLGAVAFAAGRQQGFAEASPGSGWLRQSWRVLVRIPADVWWVSLTALEQLVHPRPSRGLMRAVPFHHGEGESAREVGRRALAEGLGSLAPNTIVIGIDPERDLILAHQLRRSGGADSIDVLRLR